MDPYLFRGRADRDLEDRELMAYLASEEEEKILKLKMEAATCVEEVEALVFDNNSKGPEFDKFCDSLLEGLKESPVCFLGFEFGKPWEKKASVNKSDCSPVWEDNEEEELLYSAMWDRDI